MSVGSRVRAALACGCLVVAGGLATFGSSGEQRASAAVRPGETLGEVPARANVPATANDFRAPRAQNSPELAADPTNPRFVVLANRLDAPDFGCALQISGDEGRGWVGANPVPRLPQGAEKCYAPEVAFDRHGVLYYLFVGLAGRGNNPTGVFLTTSDDRAHTFSAPRRLLGAGNYMVRMALDPTLGKHGRLHLVWLTTSVAAPLGGLPAPPNPIVSAFSDDGGKTFSRPVQVNDPGRPLAVAPALAVGPDHAVHVLYYDLRGDTRDYQGLVGPKWPGRWSLISASSYDGGRSFQRGVVVDRGVVPSERVMLIYTMPPPSLAAGKSGLLYAAWDDARNGDRDVFLRRSIDDGRSWQSPLRLNDDRLHNGRDQYMPRLSLAPNGRLDAIFYDRRNDPQNLRNDVFYTYSTDAGAHFSPNVRLTTTSSDSRSGPRYPIPSASGLMEFGLRLGLLSRDSGALAAWTDTRNSLAAPIQDIFTAETPLPLCAAREGGGGERSILGGHAMAFDRRSRRRDPLCCGRGGRRSPAPAPRSVVPVRRGSRREPIAR